MSLPKSREGRLGVPWPSIQEKQMEELDGSTRKGQPNMSKLTQKTGSSGSRVSAQETTERSADAYPTRHLVVIGDSSRMDLVAPDSVHLVVTSPPYFDARDYAVSNQIGHGGSLDGYLCGMEQVLRECFRVLRPGRKLCLNISDLPLRGDNGVEWLPLGPLLLRLCLDVGFRLADRIIWDKTPKKGFHYGSLPYPPSPLICDSMEYVYVLRRPGRPDYSYVRGAAKERSKLAPREYQEYTKQIWSLRRVRLRDNIEGHIAPFPTELPLRCIRLYSFVGDVVLDPFAGSGTTGQAALMTERNSVMYEINPDYLGFIRGKVEGAAGLYTSATIQYVVGGQTDTVVVGGSV